ncbi:hypothetical protein BRADI_3g40775v3 [Brachypodium distachyon]|uniref:Reverse transcriptase zinc-binding domain-containing protein n=1 Tax=Brachypodium distachyon TaxID=15368 RepID=A0A2K2D2G1_BRADI|nr:hypothetical protein BRADI_3g40775v3 [Brachypodium distachyon]
MGALLLPAGTIHEIDKRCHAFFWTGEDHTKGGNCKVAWDDVCAPIGKGGLGFRCLRTQNACLLLKHLTKVHLPGLAPWEQRFALSYGWSALRDLGDPHHLDTLIWKDIVKGLDFFRNISKVTVGNGLSTSFWLDLWLGDTTLAHRFPALFSHSLRPNIPVAAALASFDSLTTFRPRLSLAAQLEFGDLQLLLSVVLNLQAPDVRLPETSAHLFLHCASIAPIWLNLQSLHPDATACDCLADLATHFHSNNVNSTIIIVVLWNIWKRRNAMVFNDSTEEPHEVIMHCASDLVLWSSRCNSPPHLTTDQKNMLEELKKNRGRGHSLASRRPPEVPAVGQLALEIALVLRRRRRILGRAPESPRPPSSVCLRPSPARPAAAAQSVEPPGIPS